MTVPPEEPSWKDVELFGGAITARFPARFGDISDVRPVPDHQEVWGDPITDQSIIIELAEYCTGVADADVGKDLFHDLAGANDAFHSRISSVQQLGASDTPHIPHGTFAVLAKGMISVTKHADPDDVKDVQLVLAVLRFPQHATDLLVSVNAPVGVAAGSRSQGEAEVPPTTHQQAVGVMMGVLNTFAIKDWSLFDC